MRLMLPIFTVAAALSAPSGSRSVERHMAASENETQSGSDGTSSAHGNTGVHYSRGRLQALIHNARTAEAHEHLAAYLRARAMEYRTKQAHEEQVLAEYLRDPLRYPPKYPTCGDVARSLAEYYAMEARKASEQASEQERMAARARTGK